MGSYAGEIPQSATKAKNDKRIEGRIEVDMEVDMVALKLIWEDLPLEPINKAIKTLQKDSEHVWVLVVDTLNTSCEAISSLFDNNYLRCDLIKSFFDTFCCVMFLDHQKTVGGLTKSDITFVLFEMFS